MEKGIEEIKIKNETKVYGNYTPPIQSANSLFNFMGKLEYLIDVIKDMALIPRYCIEDIDYLNIDIHKISYPPKIAYPMLCFCDINFHKLQPHVEFYGGYGIAFSKQWGIRNKIQPIQYIYQGADLQIFFKDAFEKALEGNSTKEVSEILLKQMQYFKPIQGTMLRNGESISKNFTDECEWRYIPDISKTKLPQAIVGKGLFSLSKYNSDMSKCSKCKINFSVDDVKYIIVKTRDDFLKFYYVIEELFKNGVIKEDEKVKLISTFVVWDEAKEDF